MVRYSTPAKSRRPRITLPSPPGLESPCERRAQNLRPRTSRRLPIAFRDMVSLDPFIGSTLNDRVLRLRGSLASPLLHAGNSLGHRRVEEVSSASDQTSASSSAPTGPSGLDGVLTRNARMHSRIRRLEKANAKLKERLEDRLDALKDARLEANQAQSDLMKIEDAHSELERAQEKLRTIEERAKVLKRDLKKFRRWWLTDYHSLKLVVSLLPESEDVVEIASSADARFASYSA